MVIFFKTNSKTGCISPDQEVEKVGLQKARQLKNMNQTQLAAAIGVTQVLISLYERRELPVPIKRRAAIEKVIGWPVQFDTQEHQRPESDSIKPPKKIVAFSDSEIIAEWEKEII